MSDQNQNKAHQAPMPESLRHQLDQFRKHLWRIKITEAILAGIFGLLFSFIVVFALDRLFPTPNLLRLVILLAGVSLSAIFAPIWINRWVFKHRRENQLARLISKNYPKLGDRLLGVIELQDQSENSASLSPRLRVAAMEEVAKAVQKRDLHGALPASNQRKWGFIVGGLLAAAIAAFIIVPAAGINALKRWIMPLSDTERYTFTSVDLSNIPNPYYVAHGEDFDINFPLEKGSNTPDKATARQGSRQWLTTQPDDRTYKFKFEGQQRVEVLDVHIGDAFHKIPVKPIYRPSLTEIKAVVKLPEYLQRPDQTVDLTSGKATILAGSTVTIQATSSRDLKSVSAGPLTLTKLAQDPIELGTPDGLFPEELEAAKEAQEKIAKLPKETTQPITASISGNKITTAPIIVNDSKISLPISWRDIHGLKGRKANTLTITPLSDEKPSCYLQGVTSEIYKLAEETVSFELLAEDDFGLQNAGIEWKGEFTKPTNDKPAIGEIAFLKGSPTTTSLSDLIDFSFEAYQIAPQKLTIRAWTEDYNADHGRSYSAPITVYILTRDEHRQLIEQRTKDSINRLEDLMRREQELLDENKRLDRLDGKELQQEENQEKLEKQEQAEQENADKMNELSKEMEDIFKEANKNGEIDKDTMKKLAETTQSMKQMAQKKMPEISKDLNESQDKKNDEEKTDEKVKDAVKKQEELLNEMQETIKKANEANKQLEAGTFINRLKRAASEEKGISAVLISAMNRPGDAASLILSQKFAEMDPVDQRAFLELALQQKKTSSDVRWIQEDLGHFYSRTQKETHKKLLDNMRSSDIDDGMADLEEKIKQVNAFKAHYFAEEWAQKLTDWAKELENANDQDGGGGGEGGDQNNEDQDFEFMLKVMKMIQKEQDIRSRTRSLEQLKRAMEAQKTESLLP